MIMFDIIHCKNFRSKRILTYWACNKDVWFSQLFGLSSLGWSSRRLSTYWAIKRTSRVNIRIFIWFKTYFNLCTTIYLFHYFDSLYFVLNHIPLRHLEQINFWKVSCIWYEIRTNNSVSYFIRMLNSLFLLAMKSQFICCKLFRLTNWNTLH